MSVTSSNKRTRPVITVVSARPLSEVGFRDTTPKSSAAAKPDDVKIREPPARPAAPPGKSPSWRRSLPPQSLISQSGSGNVENESCQIPQRPMAAPRTSVQPRPVSIAGHIPEVKNQPTFTAGIINDAFEKDVKGNHSDPEPDLISFEDEPVLPEPKTFPSADMLTAHNSEEPVYAVVKKEKRINSTKNSDITGSSSPIPPLVPPRTTDKELAQKENNTAQIASAFQTKSFVQPTPLVFANRGKTPEKMTEKTTEHLTDENELSGEFNKGKNELARGVPVFPTTLEFPLKNYVAEENRSEVSRPQHPTSPVKPKPSIKPKPAVKPKPALKPKPSVKPKPTFMPAAVISSEATVKHNAEMAEDDEIARKTKEQEMTVSNIISAMRAKLEKCQADDGNGSRTKPMKATYRPTIIRSQIKKPSGNLESNQEVSTSSNELRGGSTEVKHSDVSVPVRNRPTIIRARTASQTKLNMYEREAENVDDQPKLNVKNGFMTSAVSMPNLANMKLESNLKQNGEDVSGTRLPENGSYEMLTEKSTVESREPLRHDQGHCDEVKTADQSVDDESNVYKEIEKPSLKNDTRQSVPPPRPSVGPHGESIDSAEKPHQPPPHRQCLGPVPGKALTSPQVPENKTSQVKSNEPPPALPPRPQQGHPLFHYVVSEPHAIAVFDYEALHDDELSFKAGDVILLLGQVNEQWLLGKLLEAEGIFPASFVDVVKPPSDNVELSAMKQVTNIQPQNPEIKQSASGSGPHCIARFDYEGEEADDLSFEAGDVITLLERIGHEWLRGNLNGKTGIFPVSYVEIIEDLPTEKHDVMTPETDNIVTALYDFDGEANELSFKSGAKICVLSQVNDDWLYGETDGKKGSFPASFVNRVPPGLPKHENASSCMKTDQEEPNVITQTYCVADYDYKSDSPEDLCFMKGDRITILSAVNDDWLKGKIGENTGIFPKAFVHTVNDCEEIPPRPTDRMPPTGDTSTPRAIAKYDFMGETDDDLSFCKGQDIVLLEQISDDWLRGRIGDNVGIFPTAFVDIVTPL